MSAKKKKKNKSSAKKKMATKPVEIVTKVSDDELKEKVEEIVEDNTVNVEVKKEKIEVISQKELARQVNEELKRLKNEIKEKQDEEVRKAHEERQKEEYFKMAEPIVKAGPVESDRVEETSKEDKKKKKKDKKEKVDKTKVVETVKEGETTKQLAKIKKNELLKNTEEAKKRRIYGGTIAVVAFLVLFVLSTIFSLVNINNPNMIKGVKIQDIDVSGLSKEESKTKILEALNSILFEEITIKHNDYNTQFDYSMIEYSYDIDKAIEEAYNVGRNGNIIQNNYSIIKAITIGNNVKVNGKYNEELLDSYVDGISSKVPGLVEHPSYYIEEDKLYVVQGKDGIEVDKDKFKDRILKFVKSIKEEDLATGNYKKEIEIPTHDKKADAIEMKKSAKDIYKEPHDA